MIPPIKKILYATDLGRNSVHAFYYAIDMARTHSADILMLNVIEPIPGSVYGSGTDKLQHTQMEASREVMRNRLRTFCEKVEEKNHVACVNLVAKIIVELGDPVGEILKAAEREEVDLIVLGNHGKGFLAQTFLGSVSRSVLDRARKPVMIIPLPSEETSAWDEF